MVKMVHTFIAEFAMHRFGSYLNVTNPTLLGFVPRSIGMIVGVVQSWVFGINGHGGVGIVRR